MKTMKKFWKYFLNFLVLVILVSVLVELGTYKYKHEDKVENKTVSCVSEQNSPTIDNLEYKNKKLTGKIHNNTGTLMSNVKVVAQFYGENDNLLGTEYYDIKYFNVGENLKFEIECSYKNVEYINVYSE